MGKRADKKRLRIAAQIAEANEDKTEDVVPKYNIKASSLTSVTTPMFPKAKADAPIVYYAPKAWQKMNKAIQMCSKEVGWLGTVDVIEGGYLITDIFVPPQEVTGAETDIEADAIAEIAMNLEDPEKLYYWGHSHVNMGVSPSSQDEDQTSEYLEHTDVFIRGIYNKKGVNKVDVYDMKAEVVYQSVKNGVRVPRISDEEMEEFENTVTKNVKSYTYNYKKPATTGYYKGRADPYQHHRPANSARSGGVFNNPFIVRGKK